MHLPLIGEITPLRAFFLFLFFYSNDSNSLSTWSTFVAGMTLSNLMDAVKSDKPDMKTVITYAVANIIVLGYSTMYLEQGRMMTFLALQSLFVPVYKLKLCPRNTLEDGRQEIKLWPLMLALTALVVLLYVFDGLSGLTSGVLFLIYMPEISARMPPMPSFKTIMFFLVMIVICSPFALLVTGAIYFEKEIMAAPPEYRSYAKMITGARPESVPDYYKIIGVRRGADDKEIKKVFRELSKLYHPDKTAGHPELQAKFVEISDVSSPSAFFVRFGFFSLCATKAFLPVFLITTIASTDALHSHFQAVRKLTGKGSDRESYYRELENAELQDMITRCIYFCLLFALWFIMAFLGSASRQRPATSEGEEGAKEPQPPPKPRRPMTRYNSPPHHSKKRTVRSLLFMPDTT
jgi:hypothetical protein